MSFLSDSLGDAWRSLRRSAGTTLAAALLLGAGFAISLVVSSIAMVAFDSFGAPLPAELQVIGEADGNGNVTSTRGTDVLELRAAAPELLAGASAVRTLRLSLGGSERNRRYEGALVDGPLFRNLGWPMQFGRDFQPGDAERGALVLSHDLWQEHFGGDPGVLGRSVLVDGRAATVIGVLPDHRSYPFHEQLYLAHRLDTRSPFVARYWDLTLRSGTPERDAALGAAIAAVQAERVRLLGDTATQEPLAARSILGNGVPAESQVLIGMLMLLGGLLLVLASSNAGGLLLVHWLARARELATRSALGGTRVRLFGACLAQSLLLVTLALVLAHGVAALLLALLEDYLHSGPDGIPTYARLSLHPGATWPVLAAALGCVLLVAAPVLWRLRDPDLQSRIRAGDRGNSSSSWLGSGLFGLQCLLSAATVLLTLLVAQGATEMLQVETGLDTRQVLTARLGNADPATQERLGRALYEALHDHPALSALSLSGSVPMLPQPERIVRVGERSWTVPVSAVDAGFAAVYGVPLERGAWIDAAQVEAGARVAVLDRSAASLLFGDADAVGRSFEQQEPDGSYTRYVVQAVIAPVRTADGVGADLPSVFVPMQWSASSGLVVALRTRSGDPQEFAPELERLASAIDPALALDQVRSFAQVRHAVGSAPRLIMLLFGPIGALALLLAATGLAALLGSLVARRLRELGIRRALGASAGALLRPLLRQLGIWGGAGLVAGLALSWPLAAGLSEGLFGGAVLGVATYALTVLTIGAALLLAAAAPVRRALRVDPMQVLREE